MVDQTLVVTCRKFIFRNSEGVTNALVRPIYLNYRKIYRLIGRRIAGFLPVVNFINPVFDINLIHQTALFRIVVVFGRYIFVAQLIDLVSLKAIQSGFTDCKIRIESDRIRSQEVKLLVVFVFEHKVVGLRELLVREYNHYFLVKLNPVGSWRVRTIQQLKAVIEKTLRKFVGTEEVFHIRTWILNIRHPWNTDDKFV